MSRHALDNRHNVRMPTCALCAAERREAEPAALAWVSEREPDGGVRWICPECARRHLRDIEAKLSAEWWDTTA